MSDVARMEHCGRHRDLNAFIFRDWWALRSRFEFDLKELCKGVPKKLPAPPDKPFPSAKARAPRACRIPRFDEPARTTLLAEVRARRDHPRPGQSNRREVELCTSRNGTADDGAVAMRAIPTIDATGAPPGSTFPARPV